MGKNIGLGVTRQLGTDEARSKLPKLVEKMGRRRKAAEDLLANAYEIGPHRRGGALLIPEVDVVAARDRIEQLEEEAEELAIALLLRERAGESSADGVPLDDVIAEFGFTREKLKQKS